MWCINNKERQSYLSCVLNDAKGIFFSLPQIFSCLKLMMFIFGNLYFVPEIFFMGKRVDFDVDFFVVGTMTNYKLTSNTICIK